MPAAPASRAEPLMRLPSPRGPLGERVLTVLRGEVREVGDPGAAVIEVPDQRACDDDALTLWVLHELHYRGFEDVSEEWEWAPALMGVRWLLEHELEERLRVRYADARVPVADEVTRSLATLTATHEGPSLARHLQRNASREQALALLRQRSLYHLKEGDPTSWVIPRLTTRPKAALLEVQFDEYGDGDPARLHHEMFARGLETSGLCSAYGHYVDEALVPVLEQNNAVSMFGLHRRLRGAALGHLAAFESTSAVPSRQLAQGLTRLGFPPEMIAYYDEHVEADAVHEQVVVRDVCGALVQEEPGQHEEVVFGAWTCLDLEARTATAMLARWDAA
ncbi:MAG: iron-containing redox enzyme family protein [Nocardioides sp.]|nr:iron-containing redox enzyme family protein [Nocardioides sp.]